FEREMKREIFQPVTGGEPGGKIFSVALERKLDTVALPFDGVKAPRQFPSQRGAGKKALHFAALELERTADIGGDQICNLWDRLRNDVAVGDGKRLRRFNLSGEVGLKTEAGGGELRAADLQVAKMPKRKRPRAFSVDRPKVNSVRHFFRCVEPMDRKG